MQFTRARLKIIIDSLEFAEENDSQPENTIRVDILDTFKAALKEKEHRYES